jgi:hypothetical protein
MAASVFATAVLYSVALFGLTGCTAMRASLASPTHSSPTAAPASAPAVESKLLIFGGPGHHVYLGCLNCSKFETDSVGNTYGPHGSPYASESVFNHFSPYGSPYASRSACNEYASDAPEIVDGSGLYYGRLTLNRFHFEIGIGARFMGWLAAACHNRGAALVSCEHFR